MISLSSSPQFPDSPIPRLGGPERSEEGWVYTEGLAGTDLGPFVSRRDGFGGGGVFLFVPVC